MNNRIKTLQSCHDFQANYWTEAIFVTFIRTFIFYFLLTVTAFEINDDFVKIGTNENARKSHDDAIVQFLVTS